MTETKIQHAFHVGELAPALFARTDIAKYHSAVALMRNFFVDYRGGASSRFGTRYILNAKFGSSPTRLIPFQASNTVGYILEFGNGYIRFYANAAPIVENALTITNITRANPMVVSVVNTYSPGDWVYINGVNGMSQVNNRYYTVNTAAAGNVTLKDLYGNVIDSTAFSAYTSAGAIARIYTIVSPYAASDLSTLKFVQNVNQLIITHPNYAPRTLTLNSSTSWTLASITFGATVSAPTGIVTTTSLAAGGVNYAYLVTSVDADGNESLPSARSDLLAKQDLRTVAGSIQVAWTGATGATSYNVYKAELSYMAGAVPAGSAFGYIGNATGAAFIDSNIDPDFSQTPPISNNPFGGTGVSNILQTAGGSYTTVPVVTIAPPGAGVTATAFVYMQATAVALVGGGFNYSVGDIITLTNGITVTVALVSGTIITIIAQGSLGISSTTIPANPVSQVSTTGAGFGATFNITWTVASTILSNPGTGYGAPPAVSYSPAGATATATVGASSVGNPSVPELSQQKLVLAAPPGAVNTLYASQPGDIFNYNKSFPAQADDSFQASIVAKQLQTIKAMVAMPSGLIVFTDKGTYQLNGGVAGSAFTAIDAQANPQSYVGASDVPPIVANFDILFVQSKGSIVRDLTYNFYANIYTGTDISVLSSHLFFGYQLTEWAWAEEPFKLVWVVRNDGTLLSLTFLKEQELIGWAHHDTLGSFKSVATITEVVNGVTVDAVYVVVQRGVNGQIFQYIERMADRFVSTYLTPWCVDSGLQYTGSAATKFSGLDHLIGQTVTGLADGVVIPSTTVAADGSITLSTAASFVTIGLSFLPQIQTLPLDTGDPTIQGKLKSIDAVTVRCENTLGLYIGGDSSHLVAMKDLIIGNIGSATNQRVTGLVTGDARTIIDPSWTVPGQYFIQQNAPYPATILGVIPEFAVGK